MSSAPTRQSAMTQLWLWFYCYESGLLNYTLDSSHLKHLCLAMVPEKGGEKHWFLLQWQIIAFSKEVTSSALALSSIVLQHITPTLWHRQSLQRHLSCTFLVKSWEPQRISLSVFRPGDITGGSQLLGQFVWTHLLEVLPARYTQAPRKQITACFKCNYLEFRGKKHLTAGLEKAKAYTAWDGAWQTHDGGHKTCLPLLTRADVICWEVPPVLPC